jgi:hypothetical protein
MHMRFPKLLLVLAACLLPLAALAASPIDGTWVGKFKYPGGNPDLKVTFNLKADGDRVTGTVDSKKGPAPIMSGSINGNTFNFKVAVNDVVVDHQCTITGDTISVVVTFAGQQPTTMTLDRVAETPSLGPTPTGHWNWTVSPPSQDHTYLVSATLVYSGGELTGTYHGRYGEATLSNASFKDGVVTFDVTRDHEGKSYTLTYKGTLSGDTLTGTVAIPAFNGAPSATLDWKASRKN